MNICRQCNNQFPNRIKIDGITKSINKRKFCLECSPFGIHNTKASNPKTTLQKCNTCGEDDPSKFYGKKKYICGSCHSKVTTARGLEGRNKALNKLGNKCVSCGYSKYKCSLDIHHLDPLIKDKGFGNMRYWSWDKIEKEIANCIILCKCCHAAYHNGHPNIY